MAEDLDLLQTMNDVGDHVLAAMNKLKATDEDVAAGVHDLLDISIATTKTLVRELRHGARFKHLESANARQLRKQRYAVIIYALGFEKEDDLIAKMHYLYRSFSFPPPEDQRIRLQPREPEAYDTTRSLTLAQKVNRLDAKDREAVERQVDGLLLLYQQEATESK